MPRNVSCAGVLPRAQRERARTELAKYLRRKGKSHRNTRGARNLRQPAHMLTRTWG